MRPLTPHECNQNSRDFFWRLLGVSSKFLPNAFMSQTLQLFFVISSLTFSSLCRWICKKKRLSQFLGKTGHEPKFHLKHRSSDRGIEKIHCLQGANPVYQKGKGPVGWNSRDFFLAFWDLFLIRNEWNQLPIIFECLWSWIAAETSCTWVVKLLQVWIFQGASMGNLFWRCCCCCSDIPWK